MPREKTADDAIIVALICKIKTEKLYYIDRTSIAQLDSKGNIYPVYYTDQSLD